MTEVTHPRWAKGNPNWRRSISDHEEVLASKQVYFTWKMERWQKEIIRQAAEKRGLSVLAYARRAVLAWACRDLGLDFYDVMKGEAIRNGMGQKTHFADGKGHGEWIIGEAHE